MYLLHPNRVYKMADCWSNLNPPLSESTLNVLDEIGFKTMTPIQVRNQFARRGGSLICKEGCRFSMGWSVCNATIPTLFIFTII
jgi:hypothetical protein